MRQRRLLGFAFLLVFLTISGGFISAGGQTPRPAGDEPKPPPSAVVLYVVDGDSFQARFPDGKTGGVRLIGINAPEMTDGREDVRYWAFLAQRFAVHHLAGKTIALEYDWETRDVYGRLLAYARLPGEGEGLFNRLIIRSGFAYAFLKYPFREDYQREFRRAQQEAAGEGRGLWRKDPPPEIKPAEASGRLGEHVAVRFRCAEVKPMRRYVSVVPREGGFQVLVSKKCGLDLSGAASWAGKEMVVSGIVEGTAGRARLYVCFLRQIRPRQSVGDLGDFHADKSMSRRRAETRSHGHHSGRPLCSREAGQAGQVAAAAPSFKRRSISASGAPGGLSRRLFPELDAGGGRNIYLSPSTY